MKSKESLEITNKKPIYKVFCSGIINKVKFNIPVIKLYIYDDFIIIKAFLNKIILTNEDIENVILERPIFGLKLSLIKGIFIKNNKAKILLFPFNFSKKQEIFDILKSRIKK